MLTGNHSAVLVQLELPQIPTETLLATSWVMKLPTMDFSCKAGSGWLWETKGVADHVGKQVIKDCAH